VRILAYEFFSGGGLTGRPLPESIAREGWAMLRAIVEDLARTDGCEVATTLDARLAGRALAAHQIELIERQGTEQQTLERLASACQWSLIIAPESNAILEERTRWVERSGGRLLGSSSRAIRIASDKLACGELLRAAGVPTVPSEVVDPASLLDRRNCIAYPIVLKPRDGAGSQATVLVREFGELQRALNVVQQEAPDAEILLQPYVSGIAASISFLVGPLGLVPLLSGAQVLSADGRFRYLGGELPLAPDLARRAELLGRRAVTAVAGLQGFVGVDMVLAPALGGVGTRYRSANDVNIAGSITERDTRPCLEWDVVMEINPRLTTSYVGLRELARDNLAERMLQIVQQPITDSIAWRSGKVGFAADGQVTYQAAGPGIVA
jgi:predicted ATP-grasp superfamily ATP-dependent carboligase